MVNLDNFISCRLLQILLLLLPLLLLLLLLLLPYFPFPGLFCNKRPSSGAIFSLNSPPKGRIFPLLLLLLLLLLLSLLLLVLLLLPILLLLMVLLLLLLLLLLLVVILLLLTLLLLPILLLLVVVVVLPLLLLLILLLRPRQNHLISHLPLHLLRLFPIHEIPRSHRSSCFLIVVKVTWHAEDLIPPSPRMLLNRNAKLRRITPVRYIVLINP